MYVLRVLFSGKATRLLRYDLQHVIRIIKRKYLNKILLKKITVVIVLAIVVDFIVVVVIVVIIACSHR